MELEVKKLQAEVKRLRLDGATTNSDVSSQLEVLRRDEQDLRQKVINHLTSAANVMALIIELELVYFCHDVSALVVHFLNMYTLSNRDDSVPVFPGLKIKILEMGSGGLKNILQKKCFIPTQVVLKRHKIQIFFPKPPSCMWLPLPPL